MKLSGQKMAQPMKQVLSEKEKAQARREKLEKMAEGEEDASDEDQKPKHINKREAKL
jgi:hypothetical protein